MTRRAFIGSAGALTVLFLGGCELPVFPSRPKSTDDNAMSWIRYIDGRYTLFVPRVEMGQNIATALKQIACDELGIGWNELELRLHSTDDIAPVRATVGSESVKEFALPLARACATLRDALARGQRSGRMIAQARPMDGLRAFSGQGTFVGRTVPVEQAGDIVRGAPLYVADIRRPGMVYGRVLRAPASPDVASAPQAWNDAAARAVPGFIGIVQDIRLLQGRSQGLGIVAATPAALDRMEAALGMRWQIDTQFQQSDIDAAIDIDRHLARGTLSNKVMDDRIDRTGPWDVDLRIDIPLAAHAPIEPRAAVADFDPQGRLQLWAGSQDVFYQRDVVAKKLGLSKDQIVVHGQRVGGAFGGKTICTVELEAAVLARATRWPVKVQWTRAQEFRQGFHRPPSSHRIRVRLDNGRLGQWWHAFVSSHIFFTNAGVPAWLQKLTDFIGDDGVARGAMLPYRADRRRAEFDLVRLPVLTGPWRGLGAGPNNLAIESAIDECAYKAGRDPLAFRLEHIEDPRLARVLKRVADIAAWDGPRGRQGAAGRQGRGLACGIYKAMSYAAVVADVEVDQRLGLVRVTRLWCAHDCGRIVNPDQVKAQCEGNLVWGLGMVLKDGLRVKDSQVAATTLADAPIPELADVPPMDIALIDEGEPPTGAGETVIVAAAAAIANAVRAACGVRITRFPVDGRALRRHPA